jgi:hypothetical protein
MVFNTTLSYVSVILCFSILLVEETRENHKSLTNLITLCCIEYTSPCTGFELTTLVMIGIDYTGSCKSNYHTIMTTTAPYIIILWHKLIIIIRKHIICSNSKPYFLQKFNLKNYNRYFASKVHVVG